MRGKQDSGSFSQTGVVDSALAQAADDATRDAKQSAGKNSGSQPGQNQPDGQGGKNAAPQSNTSRRSQWFANRRRFFDSVNERVPLSVRLMSIVVIVLSIGTITITLSIRWLVTSYLIERADQQLIEQADLVFKNTRSLQKQCEHPERVDELLRQDLQHQNQDLDGHAATGVQRRRDLESAVAG